MAAEEFDLENILTPEELAKFNLSEVKAPVFTDEGDDDKYSLALVTYYCGIVGMTLCAIGLIGNVLSLVVLQRKAMRSSTYSYLSALSFCDTLVLIFTAVLLVKDLDRPVQGEEWQGDGHMTYVFRFVHPLAFTFQVISIWLTLAFTVDRYIMICHPFTAEPYCTIFRARLTIVGIFIGGIIFNIPKFFEYKTTKVEMNGDYILVNDLSAFGHNQVFKQLYHSGFYIAFVCGLPFLTLAVLNSFLINAVRLSRKRGRQICAADEKRNDTTIMLIGVVVVFFICQMPALVSRTLWAVDNTRFQENPHYTYGEICNLLIVLNSAINIVPYYFFGKRFRQEFWRMIQCAEQDNNLTRSYSLTQVDHINHQSASSRNHSLVVGPMVRTDAVCRNGNISVNLVPHNQLANNTQLSTNTYQVAGQAGPKVNGHHSHVQCPLLDDQTNGGKKCFCEGTIGSNGYD